MSPSETPANQQMALSEGGLQIWGDVKLGADAVIQGKIQGSIHGTEKIIIPEGTSVSGAVRGSDVKVEGEVQGGVMASGRLWLGPKSKIRVRGGGRSVRIEPGAEFRGEIEVG